MNELFRQLDGRRHEILDCVLFVRQRHAAARLGHALDPPKPAQSGTAASVPHKLSWEDLLPIAERAAPLPSSQSARPLFDDESGPAAVQQGSAQINTALDGQTVKLPGFVVPLAVDAKQRVTEFLRVPDFGACIHMPPLLPNQIVHVKMSPPLLLGAMYEPVWVIGRMSTQGVDSVLASAAYSIAGVRTEKYE